MKDIKYWQDTFKKAADKKFPNSSWGEDERVTSLQRQLDDIKEGIQVERGLSDSKDHAHQSVDHRIAALILDALIYAEERNVDIEQELEKALAWFEGRD